MLPQGPVPSGILPLFLPCSHELALTGMRGHPSSSPEPSIHGAPKSCFPGPLCTWDLSRWEPARRLRDHFPGAKPGVCLFKSKCAVPRGPGMPWIQMSPWLPAHGGSWGELNSGEFTIHRPSIPFPCPPFPRALLCFPSFCSGLQCKQEGEEKRGSPQELVTRKIPPAPRMIGHECRSASSSRKKKTSLIGTETKLSISSHHPEPDRNEIRSDSIRSSTDIAALSSGEQRRLPPTAGIPRELQELPPALKG